MDQSPDDIDYTEPQVWSILTGTLAEYRKDHRGLFREPETDEEHTIHNALDELEDHVLGIVTSGVVPKELTDALADFQPGSSLPDKVADLLAYNVSQHAIEFDVATDVCWRLLGLDKRIALTVVAFTLLLRAQPSPTAVKYLRQATTLFLAGYTTEVFIMCGAVLEAAMAARFPDDTLREHGLRPAYRRTGVFSLGQRMQFEETHPCFTDEQRREFWEVVNWRNDAVHVQPDIAPEPSAAILSVALLLGSILPKA